MKTIDLKLVENTPELFLTTYSDEISQVAERYDSLGMLQSWTPTWHGGSAMDLRLLLVFENAVVLLESDWSEWSVHHLNHLDHSP